MTPAGYMLQRVQAQEARSAAACESCGHPHSQHLELPSSYELRGGEIVTVPHPEYEPGKFVCRIDGCGCEVRA